MNWTADTKPARMRPGIAMSPDRATDMIRELAGKSHPSIYFESEEALKQNDEARGMNLNLFAVVHGKETELYQTKKGAKHGSGSAIILRADSGELVVLPNDANKREAEYILTMDGAKKVFKRDEKIMSQIHNAVRANLRHRREKMITKKKILYKRT